MTGWLYYLKSAAGASESEAAAPDWMTGPRLPRAAPATAILPEASPAAPPLASEDAGVSGASPDIPVAASADATAPVTGSSNQEAGPSANTPEVLSLQPAPPSPALATLRRCVSPYFLDCRSGDE